MNRYLWAFVALCLGAVSVAGAQSPPQAWDGYYVGAVKLVGRGDVTAEVDVFAAYEGQALYIDFRINGGNGVVLGAVASGQGVSAKQVTFSFTDNVGQKGTGKLSRSGERLVLHLTRAGGAPASTPVDALYRDYTLARQAAKGRSDRHPWSLGRNQPGPPAPGAAPAPKQ